MPVFLPTTLQGAEEIIESINELKNNVTSDLQPVTEKLKEDQKEGRVLPLSFPLLLKGKMILVFFISETSECLFLPAQFSVRIYLVLCYRCEDNKG